MSMIQGVSALQPVQERMLNILLVEDDEVDVMNVRRAFTKNHIANPLFVVANGLDALEQLRAGAVPRDRLVILLDIRMPRMSGLELLAALREDPDLCRIPVVILTTSLDESDLSTAYQHNVAGYLLKTNDRDRFRDEIAAFEAYWSHVAMP